MSNPQSAKAKRQYKRGRGKKSVPTLDYDPMKGIAFTRHFGAKLRYDEAADFQRLANFFGISRYMVFHMMIKYCKQCLLDNNGQSFADFMRRGNYDLVIIPEAFESEQEEMLCQMEHEYGLPREEIKAMAEKLALEREREEREGKGQERE